MGNFDKKTETKIGGKSIKKKEFNKGPGVTVTL